LGKEIFIPMILKLEVGVSKKTEKLIKPRKLEKKITEKTEPWKKPIKIFKKPIGSVRFRF